MLNTIPLPHEKTHSPPLEGGVRGGVQTLKNIFLSVCQTPHQQKLRAWLCQAQAFATSLSRGEDKFFQVGILSFFLLSLVFFAPPAFAAGHFENYDIAVLQGLDKPNARVQRFEVAVGRVSSFGPLDIKWRACPKAPQEQTPETAAFLEIDDTRQKDADGGQLFRGWMFASSPALSAM